MGRELCLIHGNCQGDVLRILLELSEQFNRHFEIRRIVNYLEEHPTEEDLSACSLFLYQYLSPRWGANATENLLLRLPTSTRTICFPNMFFKGYWPFWQKAEDLIEFADSFLETLLARKLPMEVLLKIYNTCDPALAGDFNAVAAATLSHEKEKEKRSDIKYVHLYEENWRQEQMFLTINHPAMPLHIYVANSILKMLGFMPLPEKLTALVPHPYDEFWLPIHPKVGERLALPFVSPERKYNCFASRLTHAEYTTRYLACRANSVTSLTSVLAQIPAKNQANAYIV